MCGCGRGNVISCGYIWRPKRNTPRPNVQCIFSNEILDSHGNVAFGRGFLFGRYQPLQLEPSVNRQAALTHQYKHDTMEARIQTFPLFNASPFMREQPLLPILLPGLLFFTPPRRDMVQ